jgi:hypothetical protein
MGRQGSAVPEIPAETEGLGHKEFVTRLKEHGIEETEASVTGKSNRGTFAVTFFLACLAVLESEGVAPADLYATIVAFGEGTGCAGLRS